MPGWSPDLRGLNVSTRNIPTRLLTERVGSRTCFWLSTGEWSASSPGTLTRSSVPDLALSVRRDSMRLKHRSTESPTSPLRYITRTRKKLTKSVHGERVCLLGLIDPDRLPAYLAASDIVLAPRKSGINTPLKLLDYLKSNTAIVATDTIANRQILDNDCARLTQFDAKSFSSAIIDLVDDCAERCRLAKNGYARFEAEFTFEEFTRRIEHVYRSLD